MYVHYEDNKTYIMCIIVGILSWANYVRNAVQNGDYSALKMIYPKPPIVNSSC